MTKSMSENSFNAIWQQWLAEGQLEAKIEEHVKQREPFLKFLNGFINVLPAGSKVLEIGAGSAIDCSYLAKKYPQHKFIGTDISKKSIAVGKKIAKHLKVKLELVLDDVTKSELPSESLDLIFSQGVVEHFKNPHKIMSEQVRILKKGGVLVVDVPQKFNPYTIFKHKAINKGTWPYGWETEFSLWRLKNLGKKYGLIPMSHIGYGYGYGVDYNFNIISSFGDRFTRKFPSLEFMGKSYTWLIRKMEEKFGAYFMLSVVMAFKKPSKL